MKFKFFTFFVFAVLFLISSSSLFSQDPSVGGINADAPVPLPLGQSSYVRWDLGNSSSGAAVPAGAQFTVSFPNIVSIDQSSLDLGSSDAPFNVSWFVDGSGTYLFLEVKSPGIPPVTFGSPDSRFNMKVMQTATTISGNRPYLLNANPNGGVNENAGNDNASSPISVSEPLPVDLLSFDAIAQDQDALVTWKTSTEINSEKFILEYSVDGGRTFDLATEVKGAGTSYHEQSYRYKHLNIASHQTNGVYYRLTQVDFDGKSEVFPLRFVKFTRVNSVYNLYPNLVRAGREMILETPSDITVNYKIYNGAGMLVRKVSNAASGDAVSSDGLVSGTYYLCIDDTFVSMPFVVSM